MAATHHIDNKAIGRRLQIARDRYGISQSEAGISLAIDSQAAGHHRPS